MNRSDYTSQLATARDAYRTGDYETALLQTKALVRRFGTPPFPLPVAGGLSEVDFLLDALGRKLHGESTLAPASSEGGDWILATCLYETGGHSPLMQDLATALPCGLRGLVLTLTGHEDKELTTRALARTGLPPESLHRADAQTLLETLRKVLRIFESCPPRRLFLFQHPDDTVAVAAAAALAAAGTEIWLIHHIDSYPTAGLFLPGIRILDVTPTACAFLRSVHGLKTRWLPLTCPDPGPSPREFLKHGRLRTALSGSTFKTSQVSSVSYPEAVAAVLQATGGTHVHIGPLGTEQLTAILDAMAAAGIEKDRFHHRPFAPTLVEALRSEEVDLLINTWPMGGARTAVEAMATGIPMVWHAPHEATTRYSLQMAYPGAAFWRHTTDLAALVGEADAAWLTGQSQMARQHYDAWHHPSRWRDFFAAPDSVTDPALPDGFDGSRFIPILWEILLNAAPDTQDARFEDVHARLKKQQEKLKEQQEKLKEQQEKLKELSELKQRLRMLEAEVKELRFPWVLRLWRKWRKLNRDPRKLQPDDLPED